MRISSTEHDIFDHQQRKRMVRSEFSKRLEAMTLEGALGHALPEGTYATNTEDWLPVVKTLAKFNLSRTDIGHLVGATAQHLKEPTFCKACNQGSALYKLTVERGLLDLALESVEDSDDPIERSSIRTTKLKALQVMKQAADRKDAWAQAKVEGVSEVKTLSDDELKALIKQAAAQL